MTSIVKTYSHNHGAASIPNQHPLKRTVFLKIDNLVLNYQKLTIVKDLSLSIYKEEIVCLLGPSGCGKTTLLKALAGFIAPSRGRICLYDKPISTAEHLVPPAARNITMVFQDLALFPHMTVKENIMVAMKNSRARTQKNRLDTLITALKLEHVINKYPHLISGGEQQRTALARALAPKPPLILLDEPLSSQDVELKQKLQFSLKLLLKEEKITTIFVTHDQDEAFALSDKMGVLHNQTLEQYGTPYEVYYQPASRFIADFIGKGTLINGIIEEGILISEFGRIKKFQLVTRSHTSQATSVTTSPQKTNTPNQYSHTHAPSSTPVSQPSPHEPYKRKSLNVKLLVRPDDVQLDNRSAIRAHITQIIFQGSHFLYVLKLNSGTELLSLMPSIYRYNIGEEVGIAFSFQRIIVFT
ncbi:iron(III) transport system ATP-binding protein [Spirochaetota bacterium]|nr:iron(III) transport system ATP-binding protein [Spirochaetota bacterium]